MFATGVSTIFYSVLIFWNSQLHEAISSFIVVNKMKIKSLIILKCFYLIKSSAISK